MFGQKAIVSAIELQALIDVLKQKGYRTIGPVKRNDAIIYDDISSLLDLPQGWIDEQNSASYRLKEGADEAFFGYTLGLQSWKRFLHPPEKQLWTTHKNGRAFKIVARTTDSPKMAFLCVRPCDLAAIARLDKALLDGPYKDRSYGQRRKGLFIVAVNCTRAGGSCFCDSMQTGPRAISGFDLALTELTGDVHRFLVECGSDKGVEIAGALKSRTATGEEMNAAAAITAKTTRSMGRILNTSGLKELLERNHENPRWEIAGNRCLTCGNCTMVCPTCFCTTVEDSTDLKGQRADRVQKWDSCFTVDFTYIHGGSIRMSAKARYRQMVTHKLAAWQEQFGSIGCVGCGRCITWCPAAIDITEEVRAIRESEQNTTGSTKARR